MCRARICGGAKPPEDNSAMIMASPPHILARHIRMDMYRDTYPFAGDIYVFRGRRGDLLKILWHDGLGMSLYAKRLERGRFISYGLCQCV
jgi:IS66 Orf2 like protein